jgi:anti-anti-sigma factor
MSLPGLPPEPSPDHRLGEACAFHWAQTGADASRLVLAGELDLVTADHARAALRQAQRQTRDVVCDLGDVVFVDLAGLRVLLDATSHAHARRGRLTIVNCPSIVQRMLTLLGLEGALDIRTPPAWPVSGPMPAAPRESMHAGG